MDDLNDNTTDNAPSETPPADIPEAPPETGQTQQETPEGGDEAKADSPPSSYVLDLGEFAQNLPPEEMQFLTDISRESGATPEVASALLQRMGLYHQTAQEYQAQEWAEASRNDKEFGGPNLEQNLGIAKQALDRFGSDELKEMLGRNGGGNHPEIIRFCFNVGKAMCEDTVVTGAPAAGGDARNLFPNTQGLNP